jgi:exodeoxyribonuclease VII large subunit
MARQTAPILMQRSPNPALAPRIWQVGALCRAVAESLDARFNPVAVRGEVSGFSRASSGHCYFSLKDAQGQIRCAMFRRAAGLLDFTPRDGDVVEAQGRLGVYEARGDLQLVVESLARAGQGALFEQFMRLKARLEALGLFDAERKRPVPAMPRGIGVVTSVGAAALHDVVTCLARRVPHIPVALAPAAVQGAQAPRELVAALESLYALAAAGIIDVILLVRGGGSLEDLLAFNDEMLAHTIVRSPVPLVCGVGHETDFTIADFCADLRAPTPTAAAELAAQARSSLMDELDALQERVEDCTRSRLDSAAQRLDQAAARLGRPSASISQQQVRIARCTHRLQYSVASRMQGAQHAQQVSLARFRTSGVQRIEAARHLLDRIELRMRLLDPKLVLQRGYALLTDEGGHAVTSAAHLREGQELNAALSDGEVGVRVSSPPRNRP